MAGHIITEVENRRYLVPLEETLGDASHDKHTHFELIMSVITTEDEFVGYGYTYTGGVGGTAILELLNKDVKPYLIGSDADCIEKIWIDLRKKLHYVGRGGIEAFAISATDVALWDIRCKRANIPLWKAVGGTNGWTKAYAGGIDLDFCEEKLLANIQKYLDQGHNAVKIKLGKETTSEDAQRVAAVRNLIGNDVTFMVDANYKWTAENAIRVCKALQSYDILWIEEPVDPDDIAGYKRVSECCDMAIAGGENFHSPFEFENVFEYGYLDYPQADVSNCGGITGWLKIATLAYSRHKPISTHGMQELHVSLLSGIGNPGWLEVHSFPIDLYTTHPLKIVDGKAYAPDDYGTGVIFDFDKLEQYRIQ